MFDHPLRQFSRERYLAAVAKLEEKKLSIDRLRDMTADEIGKRGQCGGGRDSRSRQL